MAFDERASIRCRRIFQGFRNREGWTDATFSHRISGSIPPSTLSRLLNTDQLFRREHALPIAQLMSDRLPCNFNLLWLYLTAQDCALMSDPPPAVIDLEAAEVYGLREAAIRPLLAAWDQSDTPAATSMLFTRTFPPQLLTEPVMKKLYRSLAESFGGDVEARYELMLSIGVCRRRSFLEAPRARIALKHVFLPDSLRRRLLRLEPPFHTCTRDEIDELIEGLLFDALRDRGIVVAFIGTVSGSVGAAIDNYFARFDSVLAFESGPVIKRPCAKPCIYYCSDDRPSEVTRRVIIRDREMLRIGRLATNYGMDDAQAMENALRRLLSIDSWADRSAHAHLFRLASRQPNPLDHSGRAL